MKLLSFWGSAFVILFTLTGTLIVLRANDEKPPFDVDQWLRDPDRRDFPWSVRIFKPSLTLQQRYAVQVYATIKGNRLPDSDVERDLHFVLKVAVEGKSWLPEYSYTRVPVPPKLDKSHIVEFIDGIYLNPGRYTIALLVYDPILKKGNAWRKEVKVTRIKNDPLPDLDRDLEDIEFWSHPLAKGNEWLPVHNRRFLCIDIISNISIDYDYSRSHYVGMKSLDILRASSVLSHLDLNRGRVRVSILDTLRMNTHFDREDATDFDWRRASDVLADQDPRFIDKNLLGIQAQAASYLFDKFNSILEDDACAPIAESPLKIIIFVSNYLYFAEGTRIPRITLRDPGSARFFYYKPNLVIRGEGLLKMIKPTKSRSLSETSFRKDLAKLISYLENEE